MAAAVGDHAAYPGNYTTQLPSRVAPAYSKLIQENKTFSALPVDCSGNGYFAGVDIASLPPLPETPSEADELSHEFSSRFIQEHGLVRYPIANHVSPYSPWEGQEVYSPENVDQAVLYYSAEELDSESPYISGETCYARFNRGRPAAANASSGFQPHSIMGSASSALSEQHPPTKSQKHKKGRNSSAYDDSGCFESGTSKPALGVKDKLRSSLDKISIKAPFRWSSSDKLTSNNVSSSSKSSKSKTNRRYSDSSAAFALDSEPPVSEVGKNGTRTGSTSCEAHSGVKDSKSRDKGWRYGVSRLIRPYGAEPSDHNPPPDALQGRKACDPPDYVNLNHTAVKLVHQSNRHSDIGVASRGRQERYMNDYQIAAPTHHLYDLTPKSSRLENSKDTVARAKGTWNMLRTVKTKQAPVRAGASHAHSYASLLSGSSETLQSSDTLQGRHNNSFATPEQPNMVEPSDEPPKLAPVSGMLLIDKGAETTIVRPTAFKLVAPPHYKANHGSVASPSQQLQMARGTSWERVTSVESSPRDGCPSSPVPQRKASVSSDSNHSDSGRISATSIPVGNNIGSNFSCSGSEGYESARVSSSTNHSAMHEPDLNGSDLPVPISPKSLSDDVMIRDLECRVKAKEGELQLLRRSFEDNEKALHMVYEDRHKSHETEIMELKQKYSYQLRAQARRAQKEQERIDRQCQISQEENRQLLRTNIELEDRIKSVTDAFEEQARQSHDVAELRARLEENESVMQQKHGEISHLKHQLKERQIEVTQRTGDVIALRNRNRELQARLRERDVDTAELSAKLEEKDQKMADLGKRLREAEYSLGNLSISGERQKDLDSDPREDLGYSASVERGRDGSSAGACLAGLSRDELLRRLEELELRFEEQGREFEKERRRWAEEKNKVIRYQKQLQMNYVQICKRSQALGEEVEALTAQLHGTTVSPVEPSSVDRSPPSSTGNLSYPMEI